MKQITAQVLSLLIENDRTHRLNPDQIARLEQLWGRLAEDMAKQVRAAESLQGIAKILRKADVESIRSRLRDVNPTIRQIAPQVVAQRRLPVESDLIELLQDSRSSTTAHEVLVRLARGTDFGPFPGSSRRGIKRSIEKWRHWLALQSTSLDKPAVVAERQAKPAALEIVPLILSHEEKPTLTSSVAKACDELVNTKGDEQRSMLSRLRHAKDNDSTEAIALAIPKLSGDIQQQAREALTARLTHLSAAALGDKLQDDNPEVRSAAALACGRKIAKEHIADLVQLLDDPEMAVVQAARVALTEMTGEDFGPQGDADRRGHVEAVAAWRQWWKERQIKPK